jgi:hypothetical protein
MSRDATTETMRVWRGVFTIHPERDVYRVIVHARETPKEWDAGRGMGSLQILID